MLRKLKKFTQDDLTAKIQLRGINIDRPIETSSREVYDFEHKAIAKSLDVLVDYLLNSE